MAHRIEIRSKAEISDTRAEVRLSSLKRDFSAVENVDIVDVYTVNREFSAEELDEIADSLTNPVIQEFSVDEAAISDGFDHALEVGFLPGVTDNAGSTAREIIEDMLKIKFEGEEDVFASQITLIKGDLTEEQLKQVAEHLHNHLIQRVHIKGLQNYQVDGGMDTVVPLVHLNNEIRVDEVDLDISDEELIEIGKKGIKNEDGTFRGPLALDLESMKTIRDYFQSKGRNPNDIELEALAQTWSEHCKHTIFASEIDEVQDGLYKHYIKRATKDIRKAKGKNDFCVSVFSDNSGGIVFDDKWVVTDKVETHNSPSALDPFGGAITGIVGVNRDTIGFGKGAMPVINKYGYCFGDPFDEEPIYRDKELTSKMLSPRRIMEGVVEGVNTGGNCSGIPTPQGFVYFHDRYKGKPLVFVGTVGLVPKDVEGEPGWEKKANPGDKIIMVGGKVGADGIHGATFSSESLDSGSPATAVQIGDPYTQKKLSDAIVKEARAKKLYSSITDNGAGGISSSIGEMAEQSGGCRVELDKVPLKYPGLEPWEIWISESQERMTLAVPPENIDEFMDLMKRRGVDAWVIGEYTDSGKCEVLYEGMTILDIDLEFMHDGNPQPKLHTNWTKPSVKEPQLSEKTDHQKVFMDMLSGLNNCSFEFISYQYDYEVLGGSCIKPLQGPGQVNSTASVTRPVLDSERGVVCSQALYPHYSELDAYNMAGAAIDTAIRNCLSVGGSLDHLALLDNFCWCSSDEPERLGQLKEAARACYDFAVKYGTPYISGKDSMFNDFKGYDAKGESVKISVPPTLLISATGVVKDTNKCITLDAKQAGDLVYVIGETKNELGGSEYFVNYLKQVDAGQVPVVESDKYIPMYQKFEQAVQDGLVESSQSIGIGGLGIALAKTAIGGRKGMQIDLGKLKRSVDVKRGCLALYSESQGRLLVTIDPAKKEEFEALFNQEDLSEIGVVTDDAFTVNGINDDQIISSTVSEMEKVYKETFRNF